MKKPELPMRLLLQKAEKDRYYAHLLVRKSVILQHCQEQKPLVTSCNHHGENLAFEYRLEFPEPPSLLRAVAEKKDAKITTTITWTKTVTEFECSRVTFEKSRLTKCYTEFGIVMVEIIDDQDACKMKSRYMQEVSSGKPILFVNLL